MKVTQILDIPIHSTPKEELEKLFAEKLNGKSFHHLATVNPEFLVEARKSDTFFSLLKKNTWLNICDGFGIQLAGIFSGKKIIRITGVETADILCKICEQEKKKIALIGGFGVAQKSKEFLLKKYPKLNIVFAEDGDPQKNPENLLAVKPDAILVAFGSPAQEYWLQKYGKEIGAKVGIGVGGTFDFWTSKRTRAPKVLQKIGLEWFWRLLQEPSRWKRIFNAVIIFPLLVWEQKLIQFIQKK